MTRAKPPQPADHTKWRARGMVASALRSDSEGEFSMKEAVVVAMVGSASPELHAALDSLDHELELTLASAVAQRLAVVEMVLDPLIGYA